MSASPDGFAARLPVPFGCLGIGSDGTRVTMIAFLPATSAALAPRDPLAARACRELERYLADPEFRFALPLALARTAFQQRFREALLAIPPGRAASYGELARTMRTAPRAVGNACAANPIAVVVPCHRVVGSRGALGGFMGERAGAPATTKRWLLVHEGYRFGE